MKFVYHKKTSSHRDLYELSFSEKQRKGIIIFILFLIALILFLVYFKLFRNPLDYHLQVIIIA